MSLIDDLVAQKLNEQKQGFFDEINASKLQAQSEIDTASAALNRRADELVGFKNGIIAPAYGTSTAGSLVRDSLGHSTSSGYGAPAEPEKNGAIGSFIGLVVAYYVLTKFIFKRR